MYNPDQILFSFIIFCMLLLFILNKWRYDIVALMALLILILFGIISPQEALKGFSHPATITVALVLILSQVLTRSGATKWLLALVHPFTAKTTTHILGLGLIAACCSMFMNNVGALALLMPIAIESSKAANRHPSLVLMPLSFASLLGGLVTLIGTPPNIIISHYRKEVLGQEYSMFDFAPVGGFLSILGIMFISAFAWRILKSKIKPKGNTEPLFEIENYLTEIKINKESAFKGKNLREIEELIKKLDITLVSLISKKQRYYTIPKTRVFLTNDILLVEGSPKDIDTLVTNHKLSIGSKGEIHWDLLHSENTDTIEVVISPNSSLNGATIEQIRFKSRYDINLLGVCRQGRRYRGRIQAFRAQVGDVLLLHGEREHLNDIITTINCYPLAERGIEFGRGKFAFHSIIIFILAILAATFNIMPLYVSFALAIVVMIIIGILPIREIYTGIDWPVIILLAVMIPISGAMESTGITKLIIENFFNNVELIPPVFLLGILLIVTMTLSDLLNNAATVLLMAPIAKALALQGGYNIDPFLMAVAIGASCAFLSPIGHQNNALIMGPGGYKFSDFWRVGLPLEILIVIAAVPLLLKFWPL